MNNQSPRQARGANNPWQAGEIAFLKSCEYFRAKEYHNLIASGHVHPKATAHPVIILQAGPNCAIITTVTAFNSGPEKNFLPPWRMSAHQEKRLDDFHAFVGTKLPPNSTNTHLKLSDPGAKMNKPQASWVYIKHFFTVPYTVLLPWDKVPQQLRLSEQSLAQLRRDIERKYISQLQAARDRLTTRPTGAEAAPSQRNSQARQTPQRLRKPRTQRQRLQRRQQTRQSSVSPATP